MNNLVRLLKNDLIRLFKINQIRYGDDSQRNKAISLLIIVFAVAVGLIILWVNSLYSLSSYPWTQGEVIEFCFAPMIKVCIMVDLFIGALWGSGLLLADKNVELKLSFPIPMIIVSLSKLCILYIFLLLLNAFLLFPMMFLYSRVAETSTTFFFLIVVVVLLLPVIPSLMGTIIGSAAHYLMRKPSVLLSRLKSVSLILVLFAYLAYVLFHVSEDQGSSTAILFSNHAEPNIFDKAIISVLDFQPLPLLSYLFVVLLFGYLMTRFISSIFQHWHCSLSRNVKSGPTLSTSSFVQKDAVISLITRERQRYFSIPVYVINTALGYVMATVFVIFAVVTKERFAAQIYQFGEVFHVPHASMEVLYVYLLTILTSLSCTTYPSISIEGHNIELVKSMPLTAIDFFKAKVLFHLSLSIPVILVLNTFLSVGLRLRWEVALLGYIMPIVFSVFIGVVGCIANLLFPNFNWENVTYIVKQSIPAILNALIGTCLSCGGFFILIKYFSEWLLAGSMVICIIVVALSAVAFLWLKVKGKNLYCKL